MASKRPRDILDDVFGRVETLNNPSTKAFLNYRIPERFDSTTDEVQAYYPNIIESQTDLLKTYSEDVERLGI